MLPLNKAATAALVSVEPDPAKRSGSVFKRWDGSHWGQMRTAFAKVVERAGVPDFRFYSPLHLRTAVESLDGLTPAVDRNDARAHKMTHGAESLTDDAETLHE